MGVSKKDIERMYKVVLESDLHPSVVICSICGVGARNRSEMCEHLIELFDDFNEGLKNKRV